MGSTDLCFATLNSSRRNLRCVHCCTGKFQPLTWSPQSLLTGFPNCPTLDSLRRSLIRNTPIEPGRTEHHGLRSPDSPGARADTPDWPGRSVGPDAEEEWEWSSWSQNWDRVMKPLVLSDVRAEL